MNPVTRPGWWQPIGTIGNTLANGAGAPASTVGNVSDFYIVPERKSPLSKKPSQIQE